MNALGMIEVYGLLAAVEALDSALKAANVNLIDVSFVQGGLVTVMVTGDVGATKAAMDASKTAAERVGKVISVHVIPRPSGQITKIIPPRATKTLEPVNLTVIEKKSENKLEDKMDDKSEEIAEEIAEEKSDDMSEEKSEKKSEVKIIEEKVKDHHITPEKLKAMSVENLRKLARNLKVTNMTNKQIRFGTKNELIRSISEFIEQER